MTTTLTQIFEGPPSCRDCQGMGIPVCSHIGFNDEAWAGLIGCQVMAPGLDKDCGPGGTFVHTLRAIEISPDRKTVTLTVDTTRPARFDLVRNLSILGGPKALVRAVHADTGDVLAEGAYDAYLQPGQEVSINGTPHMVTGLDHPNRDPESGTTGDRLDWQVATLQPVPQPELLTPVGEGSP